MRAFEDETYFPPEIDNTNIDLDAELQQMMVRISEESLAQRGKGPALVYGGNQIEIPEEFLKPLAQIIQAMSQGYAVSVVPHTMMVSTQEAADILGISRPTLVKMLKDGKIPFQQQNRHRKLYLSDVVQYQERQRRDSDEALSDMISDSEALGDYEVTPAEYEELLKTVRKEH